MRTFFLVFVFGIIVWTQIASAKPEYAVKQNVNCTACHINAWGGGPRNVYGKIFGSKNFPPAKTSLQDTYAASLRGIAYYPRASSTTQNGLAFMEASASANVVPIEGGGD